MKQLLLFLLLVIGINTQAQAPDLHVCDFNNMGFATFDLSVQTPILLNGASPNNYSVSFHQTMQDAANNTNPLPYLYTSGSNTMIYARVELLSNGTFTISTFRLFADAMPQITPQSDNIVCDSYTLPQLNAGNYYTQPGGQGSILSPGTTVTATMVIYVYAQTPGGCTDEDDFMIVVNQTPPVPNMPNITTCGSYELPMLPYGNYFTNPGGNGVELSAGDVITASQTIYIFASSNGAPVMCTSETSFTITITPEPNPHIEDAMLCSETGGYLFNSGLLNNFSFTWSLNGVVIAGATQNTYLATTPGTYTVEAQSLFGGCAGSSSAVLHGQTLLLPDVSITGQTVTVNVNAGGTFTYTLDGITQESNVFYNVSFGTHTLNIAGNCGIHTMLIDIITPDAPDGNRTQTFLQGQTLADVVANGQNIQWYANDRNDAARFVDMPLPLNTVLVNNTTYYATQTINGIESIERLPVTVTVTLGVKNHAFTQLKASPNPVINFLEISNQSVIDKITVYNLLGQLIQQKAVNTNSYQVDFSGINTGIYVIKIQSENSERTIRIMKK